MANFLLQNILNRELVYIFIWVPKTPVSSDHVHLDWNKQNPTNLQKTLHSRKNIKDFLAFLYPDIDSKSK